jgi:hypothetical protein
MDARNFGGLLAFDHGCHVFESEDKSRFLDRLKGKTESFLGPSFEAMSYNRKVTTELPLSIRLRA